MKQSPRVGQFNPVWQHHLFPRKINTVLIRLKFSRRSCYTGVMHDGSENGVARKRNGSDNWYYRRTIPADVRRILEKLPKDRRPRGWYQTHIMISTGTPDRTAAKTTGAEIAANVERQLKALRDGPKPLTAKQVSALSGIAYRAFAERLRTIPV